MRKQSDAHKMMNYEPGINICNTQKGGIFPILLAAYFLCILALVISTKVWASGSYTETKDCAYPSEWIPVNGEHGQISYLVKQDPRCEEKNEQFDEKSETKIAAK